MKLLISNQFQKKVPSSIVLLDDTAYDASYMKSDIMKELLFVGRHFYISIMLIT